MAMASAFLSDTLDTHDGVFVTVPMIRFLLRTVVLLSIPLSAPFPLLGCSEDGRIPGYSGEEAEAPFRYIPTTEETTPQDATQDTEQEQLQDPDAVPIEEDTASGPLPGWHLSKSPLGIWRISLQLEPIRPDSRPFRMFSPA